MSIKDYDTGSWGGKDSSSSKNLGQFWSGESKEKKHDSPWYIDTLRVLDAPRRTVVEGIFGEENFEDVLDKTGWKDEKNDFGAHDIVSFLGDTLLDPLTYLTLGAGSALKAGQAAAKPLAREIAEKAGVSAAGSVYKIPDRIYDATKLKHADNTNINPDLVERLATNKYQKALQEIDNAAKVGREKAQNKLINFDIPFTNVTRGLERPNFLRKTEDTIGSEGASAVDSLFENLSKEAGRRGVKFDPAIKDNVIKNVYNVGSASRLTAQQLAHLQDQISNLVLPKNLPDFNVKEQMETIFQPTMEKRVDYKKFDPDELLDSLDPRTANQIEPLVRNQADDIEFIRNQAPESVEMLADFIKKISRTTKGKTADRVRDQLRDAAEKLRKADNTASINYEQFKPIRALIREIEPKVTNISDKQILRQIDDYIADSAGKTNIGRKVEKATRGINARTFGTGNRLVDEAAAQIQDAETQIYGQTRQMERDLGKLEKEANKLTEAERRAVPYILEDHFPGNVSRDEYLKGMDKDKILRFTDQVRKILDEIGEKDIQSGVIKDRLSNYFPHVKRFSEEESKAILDKYEDDPELRKLIGRSQANRFGKQRESFPTMASLDNYLEKLGKVLAKTTDEEKAAEISEKMADIAGLFERDPIDALAKRYYRSIRSRAMHELYNRLQRNGLLVRAKNGVPSSAEKYASGSNNFKLLKTTDREHKDKLKALGLEVEKTKGYYIHKSVLNGLEKVEGLFTDEGMQKFLDAFDRAQNVWKTLVTTYMPSHHFFNFVGNVANSILAGIRPQAYVKAGKLLNDLRKGKIDPAVQEAIDRGVLHQGFISDFSQTANKVKELSKVEQIALDNKAVNTVRKGGDTLENFTRLALYVHARDQLGSAKKAADTVRKYLFNYRELTDVDRGIRIIAPFWTWTKNNLPLQMKNLLKQPRYYQAYHRMREELQGDFPEDEIPVWARDEYTRIGENTFFNPRVPLTDLGSTSEPLRTPLNMLSPAIKTPFEIATNRQIFSDRPIDWDKRRPEDSYDPADVGQYLLKQTGAFGRGIDAFNSEDSVLDTIGQMIYGKPLRFGDEGR